MNITEKDNQGKKEYNGILSLREKFAYGIGDMGNDFLFDMGQLYLLKYFTDIIGLPAVVAGTVFLVAKIWDAFSDLAVGTFIDNRRIIGKRGKFRPFILWAALPLALLLVANFSIPNISITGQEVWAYVCYMAFGTVYSVSNIAYGSMQPAMTKNSIERAELASWRNGLSNVGMLLTTVAFMPLIMLFPTERVGYSVVAGFFAFGGILCHLFCYHGIRENYREEIEHKKDRKEILKSYKAVIRNKPLLILCLANLCTFSAYNVKLAVQFYFAQYTLHNITIISFISFFTIGCQIVASAAVPFFSKKFGKKNSYIFSCILWLSADILGYFFTNSGLNFAIFTSIAYLGNGMLTTLNWALISDVVEYGEWKTNIRSEGIVYSFYTYFRKLSQALAGLIPGLVLAFVHYVPNQEQTATALLGIRALVFLYPAAMAILTAVLMMFYPLSDEKYTRIISELRLRHND